jgi:hypothetical protein
VTVGEVLEVMVYRLAGGGGEVQTARVLCVEGDVVELQLGAQRQRWSPGQVATQRELAARSRRWDAWQRARAERGNVSSAGGAG